MNAEKALQLPIEYSDKQVSPWGGLRFVEELLQRIGLHEFIN